MQTNLPNQEVLAHADRLNSIGKMASTLVHELNQPLFSVGALLSGCLHIIEQGAGNKDQLIEALNEAQNQVDRAGKMLASIQRFMSSRGTSRSGTNLNTVIQEAVRLVEPEGQVVGVPIQTRLADSLPEIEASAVQIEQVVLNIARNTFEIMKEIDLQTRELVISTQTKGEQELEVSFSINGPELPANRCEKILNSICTTASDISGQLDDLEIGLLLSRMIIESHGGALFAVPAEPGKVLIQFTLPTLQNRKV